MADYDRDVRVRAILKMGTSSRLPSQERGVQYDLEGAVLKEQNVTFAVVAVKQHVVENRAEAYRTLVSFTPMFPGLPLVLMGQDSLGHPKFYGRRDIVNFLVTVPVRAIPWRKYEFN